VDLSKNLPALFFNKYGSIKWTKFQPDPSRRWVPLKKWEEENPKSGNDEKWKEISRYPGLWYEDILWIGQIFGPAFLLESSISPHVFPLLAVPAISMYDVRTYTHMAYFF
jgi:hypothetical protein